MGQLDEAAASCRTPDDRRQLAVRILDTPLTKLLGELNVVLDESSITDAHFYGAVIKSRAGRVSLLMPPRRSEPERDTVARSLLSHFFDAGLDDLPAPFVTIKGGKGVARVQLTDVGLPEGRDADEQRTGGPDKEAPTERG
ncbi:hypothetical protein ACIBUY_15740 [Streptomyces sp. NPDC050085]|uniref:hypothetical protein n=1 Tax=Streptomyces sp. NPDC050085 TaxID=3365600 RepID=UPI0037A264BE